MNKHDNLAIAEEFIKSLEAFDNTALSKLVTDDFTWQVVSPSFGAKPQLGKGFSEIAMKMQGAQFIPGALTFEIVRTAVDGGSVVLEVNTSGTTKKGRTYNNWYIHWFEMQDGKIKLWREHVDTKYLMDTFYAESVVSG